MRKMIAAAAVGAVLVAGQAIAANTAAPSLRVGDRIGASVSDENDFALFGVGLGFSSFTSTLLTLGFIATTVVAVDAIAETADDSESD